MTRLTHHLRRSAAACVAIALCACTREPPTPRVATRADSLPSPPPVEASRFDLPLSYDFSPILPIIERTVPKTFGSIDSVKQIGDDDHKHYAYQATRGAFDAFARGDMMHLRATLAYQARGFYKPLIGPTLSAGCGGDTPPRITLELATRLGLTSDWHLASHAQLVRIQPASDESRDKCHVTVLKYDVTQQVIDAARAGITGHLRDIDGKVRGVSLRHQADGWWALLNHPIQLHENLWLLLGPERIRLGDVTGSGHTLHVRTGLDAHPRIVTGAKPSVDLTGVPDLAHDSIGKGFHILVDGTLDYASASRTLNETLAGKSMTTGGKTITVRSFAVHPLAGGRLSLVVMFTGDAAGRLALVGTPKYDRVRDALLVPDLDYDLATSDPLVRAYAWLRSDALRSMLRDRAQLPVRPLLQQGGALLQNVLNRKLGDAVTLSAKVDTVAVRDGVFVTRDGIVVRAEASGSAAMDVRQ